MSTTALSGFTYSLYAVSPQAAPVSYSQIQLAWSVPRNGATLQVVRNPDGPPANPSDGVILVSQPAAGPTGYLDTPPDTFAGRCVYYRWFVQDAAGVSHRAGDAQTVLPVDWGYTTTLKQLPEWCFLQDAAQGLPLTRFLDLLAYEANISRTWLEQLTYAADPMRVPANLLPGLAALLGADIESDIGYRSTRRLLGRLVHLYKTKGTIPGLSDLASALTGWAADIGISENLVLLPDLVGAAQEAGWGSALWNQDYWDPPLTTGAVTSQGGVPFPPTSFPGAAGSYPLPQFWPSALPADLVDFPAQAWFYGGSATLRTIRSFVIDSLAGRSPLEAGIPLQDVAPQPAGVQVLHITATATYTLEVDAATRTGTLVPGTGSQPPTTGPVNERSLPWGSALWGTDVWAVSGGLSIAPPTLPGATVGSSYDHALESINASGKVVWSVAEGELPPGLILTPTGEITGVPSQAGSWTFVIQAVDSAPITVPPEWVISSSIWLWAGLIDPAPEFTYRLHFWGASGADLGYSAGKTLQTANGSWQEFALNDVSIPAGAVFVSYELAASAPVSFYNSQRTHSVIVAAMPTIVPTPSLGPYTPPRDIEIVLHAERTNLVPNPSFGNNSATGWSGINCTITPVPTPTYAAGSPRVGPTSALVEPINPGAMFVLSDPMAVDQASNYVGSAYLSEISGARLAWVSLWAYDDNGNLLNSGPYVLSSGGAIDVAGATVDDTFHNTYADTYDPTTLASSSAPSSARPTGSAPALFVATQYAYQPLPAGTASVRLGITWLGVTVSDQQLVTAAMLEQATTVGSYFDGDTAAGTPAAADYLWSDPSHSLGPSYFYSNRNAKFARLSSVLEGGGVGSLGAISPFSRSGFLPLGATYRLLTDQPNDLTTVGEVIASQVSSIEWGTAAWSTGSWANPSAGAPGGATSVSGTLSLAAVSDNGSVGVPYRDFLGTADGQAPYSYSITSGALPPGVELSASTGTVSGVPTTTGTYTFTLQVTDSTAPTAQVGEATYTVTIGAGVAPLAFSLTTLAAGTQGAAYDQTLVVTGGYPPYQFAGSTPPGLSLSTSGEITAAALSAVPLTFPVTVTDTQGQTLTQVITVPQ